MPRARLTKKIICRSDSVNITSQMQIELQNLNEREIGLLLASNLTSSIGMT
jgi:hypothetical protein